jgi:aspartate dehydrogenase
MILKVGLIGCGAIGLTLARAIVAGKAGDTTLIAACDRNKNKLEYLKEEIPLIELFLTTEPDEIIHHDSVELLIEAATREALKAVAEKTLGTGKDLLIMSVGALSDNELLNRLRARGVSEATGPFTYRFFEFVF